MSHRKRARQARDRMTASTPGHRTPGTARLFTAGLVMVALGCTEPTAPTRTLTPETPALAAGGNQRVKVKTFQLSANTLRIDGPAVTGAASIGNSGPAIPEGVSLQAVIQQGTVTRQASNAPIVCTGAPGDVGKLPTGNCDVTLSAQASNSSPDGGTLVAGAAVLVLRVIQTVSGTDTELASKSVNVNLVSSPSITSVSLAATTLFLDGAATTYTAVLNNPANSLQGVFLQAWIRQGLTRRNAVGYVVLCGGGGGVFPPGTCTATNPVQATSLGQGGGTLVPGPAVFELELSQNTGGATSTFDTKTIAIVLVTTGTPSITDVTLQSTTLLIGGPSVDYTAQLQNPGPADTDILLQGEMEQDQAGGTVLKGAGGTYVQCGAALGVLPTGTCNVPFTVTALGDGQGGSFVPGPARFVLHLYKTPLNQAPIEYDQRIINVTLVAGTPSIVSITPASNYVVLDKPGSFTNISVNITNPGAELSTVLIQGWIRQGTARRAAGGTNVTCGPASGTLPNGTCVQESVIVADNGPSAGTGTLVPGDATFELELKHFDGTTETIFETKTVPITLVANTLSIVSVSLASTTLVINGPRVGYTATLYNPDASITGVAIQGYIDQGATTQPAGGVSVNCTNVLGEIPPGSCVASFTVGAANGVGIGSLVPGPATLRMELWQSGVLATKLVSVTLVNP